MLHTEILEQVIRAAILSAKVKREDVNPVSLFLIAPVENGKTSLAVANSGEKTLVLTDVSGIGLLEALQQNKDVTHVVINDLAAVQGHRSSVSQLTVTILNALSEEGSYNIALPKLNYLSMAGRKVGVIACCIPEMMHDNRLWWKKSGFDTRLLNIRYMHSPQLKIEILNAIRDHDGRKTEKKNGNPLRVPEVPIYVKIPPAHAQTILDHAKEIADANSEMGYRREKQLRALCCGHRLMGTWKAPVEVGQEQMDFLKNLFPYIVGIRKKNTVSIQEI